MKQQAISELLFDDPTNAEREMNRLIGEYIDKDSDWTVDSIACFQIVQNNIGSYHLIAVLNLKKVRDTSK
jgi:hypothetical protein